MPSHLPLPTPIACDSPLEDEVIVERVRAGDRQLYELLMRRYNQRLYRIARGIVGNEAEAEDVLQESYVRAFEHLDQFRGESKFATWLTRIAVHEATRRRSRSRKFTDMTNPEDIFDAMHAESSSPGLHGLEQSELRAALTSSIDRLPEGLRTVFILREVEGLSTEEAAECLTISPENVRIQLHRARGLMKSDIDQRLGSEVRKLYQFGAERCDRLVAKVMKRIQAAQ